MNRGRGIGSLAVSVLALLISLGGILLSSRSAQEERAVSVDAVAVANQLRRTETGIGISVSLSNASLRPVIVRAASVLFDGKRLGPARGYVADAVVLDRIQENPGRVVDETRQLPFTLDVRQGRTVGIFIQDDSLYSDAIVAGREKKARAARKLVRLWKKVLSGEEKASHHTIKFELDLLPGGKRTFPLQIEPAMTALFAWQTTLAPLGRTGVAIGLRRKAAEPGQAGVFRLDVWARDGRYHRAFERPLIADGFTEVQMRGLLGGVYLYAFRVDGRAAVTGCFRVPARSFDDRPCFDGP